MVTGKKANVSHLRVFGSICYVYRQDTSSKSESRRADPAIFMGYNSEQHAYDVLLPHKGKVIACPYVDCVFDESLVGVAGRNSVKWGELEDDLPDFVCKPTMEAPGSPELAESPNGNSDNNEVDEIAILVECYSKVDANK